MLYALKLSRLSGLPASAAVLRVSPVTLAALTRAPFPRVVLTKSGFIPSWASALLWSFSTSWPAPLRCATTTLARRPVTVPEGTAFLRVPSLFATSPKQRPLTRRSREHLPKAGPLRSAPRVSHPLSGLLRASALRPCFMPQPRPGFRLQGFASPATGWIASRRPRPSRRFRLPAAT